MKCIYPKCDNDVIKDELVCKVHSLWGSFLINLQSHRISGRKSIDGNVRIFGETYYLYEKLFDKLGVEIREGHVSLLEILEKTIKYIDKKL